MGARISTAMSTRRPAPGPDHQDRSTPCWLVRSGTTVVGPVSLDRIERGVLRGKIPPGADLAHVDHRDWWPLAWTFPFTSEEARARATLTERPAPATPAAAPPASALPPATPPPVRRRRSSGVQPTARALPPLPRPIPLPSIARDVLAPPQPMPEVRELQPALHSALHSARLRALVATGR